MGLINESEFQIVSGAENGLLTVNTLNTSSPSNENLLGEYQIVDSIPIIPHTQGKCFDINNLPKTETLQLLLNDLCEVMIRFRSAPNLYQKADYEKLIKTITNSLIYLYTKDAEHHYVQNVINFVGIAALNTNPIQDSSNLKFKYPGMYLIDTAGTYANILIGNTPLIVSPEDLKNNYVYIYPVIENEIFKGYELHRYTLDVEENLKPILYEDLFELWERGDLSTGMQYLITDYTTTTAQADTQSVGHDFDVVVTALSTNELSEVASCVRKSSDTYFENANLEAWEIKYCINNDTTRFAWANTANGKGVIYYMKDEWGNECPYDFKNIQFKKYSIFLYTFGGTTDDSLTGGCHHNTMMGYTLNSVLTLNFNTFGNNCYYNMFGYSCTSNMFGTDCQRNTFGVNCTNNTFGNGCSNNTFGTYCSYNAFGSTCNSNTFGNYCGINTFGNNCGSNTFKNGCGSNTFGNDCYSNTFGTGCSNNTFGTGCYYNTFGNKCSYNNFYAGLSGTTKKDYIKYLVLEDGCRNNNFYSTLTTRSNSFLQRIRIKGLEHTTATNIQITLPTTNNNYEWVICRMSDGTLKQYCPDEEINKLLPLIYAGL